MSIKLIMKLARTCAAIIILLASTEASATTIFFDTVPTDTTYIDQGLLLGSSTGDYSVGYCGDTFVGCLGNSDPGEFAGILTLTFVDPGTSNQSVTDMIEFLMCNGCAFRGSSAQVFDAFGGLMATLDLNTDAGIDNRTFTYAASGIGSLVIDLGDGLDGLEYITFGSSSVTEPSILLLIATGLLGLFGMTSRRA